MRQDKRITKIDWKCLKLDKVVQAVIKTSKLSKEVDLTKIDLKISKLNAKQSKIESVTLRTIFRMFLQKKILINLNLNEFSKIFLEIWQPWRQESQVLKIDQRSLLWMLMIKTDQIKSLMILMSWRTNLRS